MSSTSPIRTDIVRHNDGMTDLDATDVLAALTRDQRLQPFVRDGVVAVMPARQSRRRLLLNEVALAFEPGVHYSERTVSLFLRQLYPDYAALRRYLIDEGFLDRRDGEYWRCGGS
jgi:hypothetical protein